MCGNSLLIRALRHVTPPRRVFFFYIPFPRPVFNLEVGDLNVCTAKAVRHLQNEDGKFTRLLLKGTA